MGDFRITDITSIIAVLLSLFNFCIIIKKEFFKPKPSLKINIKDAILRYNGSDKTIAQMLINMSITPLVKYNGIKELYLVNSVDRCLDQFSTDKSSYVKLKWFYNLYTVEVFKKNNFKSFAEYVRNENRNREAIEEIASNVDIPYKFTLLDQFTGIRYSDGYDDFQKEGFSLKIIDLLDNTYNVPLNFDIIS